MKTLFSFISMLYCTIIFAQDKMYVHTASSSNILDNVTYLDHPDLNNNSVACLNYVHVWNPTGSPGIYNNNTDGLWYDTGINRWAIYNEISTVDMIEGVSFNIYIADDGQCIDHIATIDNTEGGSTDIDDALFNGNDPGPYAFMNTYYNPNSVYNPGNWSMYYYATGAVRSIFENNNAAVPEGSAFKIAIPGASTTRFTHTATTDNIVANYTLIDHPELNNNPDATFLFLHYFGVGGIDSNVHLNATTGIWFNGIQWAIFTEGFEEMPVNIAFDIVIAPNVPPLAVTENTEFGEVSLFPNPSTDFVIINTPNINMERITIYSILGQEIASFNPDTSEETIDVSALSAGTYLVKIEAENATKTMRFIKL